MGRTALGGTATWAPGALTSLLICGLHGPIYTHWTTLVQSWECSITHCWNPLFEAASIGPTFPSAQARTNQRRAPKSAAAFRLYKSNTLRACVFDHCRSKGKRDGWSIFSTKGGTEKFAGQWKEGKLEWSISFKGRQSPAAGTTQEEREKVKKSWKAAQLARAASDLAVQLADSLCDPEGDLQVSHSD